MNSFDCDRCGICCKNIRHANFPHDLDRGDGVCKHLTADNLCEIYSTRPIFCNVDAYWGKFLSDTMSREKFHELNHAACQRLKNLTAQANRANLSAKLGAERNSPPAVKVREPFYQLGIRNEQ